MSEEATPAEAAAIAAAVAKAWPDAAAGLPADAAPGAPMLVRSLAGVPNHWFVPVLAGDRLVAFLRFSRAGVLRGVSSFLRQPGRLEDAPAARDWLDAAVIRARCEALARADEVIGEPMLSFDGAPDRLAWAVPLDSAGGRRWAFVAGEVAWIAPIDSAS